MPMDLDCAAGCPLTAPQPIAPFDFPVGQVRRVAPVGDEGDVDETRRNILKLAGVGALVLAGGGLGAAALQYAQPPVVGLTSYPRVQLIDADGRPLTIAAVEQEYSVDTSDLFIFNYPLRNEPNFFLNLSPANGQAPSPTNPGKWNAPGGIGTHGSILGYSAICQHLGCPAPAISYYPPGTCPKTFDNGALPFYIHCSCHGSTYDVTNRAANLTGPAVLPLPQVVFDTDSAGNIFAVGLNGPPVNGHLNSLQGDYGVASTVQLTRETPIILCSFPA